MFEPIIIKLDYSPRDERHSKQVKSVASRLGKRIGSGLIDRPNIGKNRRKLGSGRIDIPTGGVRGYKKPTGNRLDFDRDGWADEGTTNPVWVGLSSGQDRPRPVIETQRVRPKINLNNKKINERKKIRQKIKYGESSLDGKLISRKSGPKWLDGLSNEQISNILVPDSYQTYSQMLADGFGVDKETIEKYLESRWGVGKPWLEIDYSENSIKELRQALKSALDESPIFSWAVRNYGSPTYTVMTRKSAEMYNNRDAVKPLYEALKKMYPDAPGQPQFAASNHLDFEMVTFNPVNVVDKKSWRTNEPISSSFQTSKSPSDSDTVIDRSIPGTILHEWAHWYHSEMLLANIESSESKKRSPKSLINPQDTDFAEKIKIALEYNSDNGNMNLHLAKKPLEDSPGEPRTITSYGHVSKKEMFAEGMLAYMHPNEQLKLKAINKKLRQDIETILAGDKGVDAWKDSKANIRREKNILSSGRKNRKLTKLSSGSKTEELKKPTYPRHPSYGPFLDGADDVFADVKNWKEFKEVYDNLEINFFDYETTGLVSDEFQQSSGNGAPVQFGVTKTKGGKEIGRLNIFMNPGEELSDWSRKNLKNKDGEPLTDEWLSSQTSIADAHRKLIEFVGPDAIFGVQNAVFDKTVLEDALTSSGIEWRPKGWVDTKVVADFVIPKWTKENQDAPWTTDRETGEKIPSSSLKALTEYLNIDLGKKHHTADADAAATSELMSKIIDKAIEKNWSNDIFDKNWRDQKTKDKLENHQQKIVDFEQQKNNWISENKNKTKLSSGAAEPIKDIWIGDRYIRSQTYKNMGIGFTGEPRLRDVPSGKRFVEMKVIDSVDGRLNFVDRDEARTFTEKTISAAIDWLLDRQIQTEAVGSLYRRFILTEEQFKEFLTADIKATKAKPDPNKKKYPPMKKGFRVDEKELASLSEDKPDNRMLVQVPNRFWDDHLSRLDKDFNSPEVRGQFRTETRLNYFELDDLISDADYYIETAGLPGEEFDSMGAEQLMDALIKQGIPIENGKLKLSSGKTNRANRRANNSKLSSGSQPRMNLSDEEKREIIAIASQRTDDFSKSVVAQFRRNGKLSDRQWNALNRATLRRSRLSSGKNIDTEPRFLPIENLTAARDSNTDTNLQTPANQEFQSKRRAARRNSMPRVGSNREIDVPLELQLAIIEDYKNPKLSIAFIAKKFNVPLYYVSRLVRQYNVPYRRNIQQNLTGTQRANIIEAIKNGTPYEKIIKTFNITPGQLKRLKFISENGATRALRLSRQKVRIKKENEEVIKLFNEGLSIGNIARRIKKSPASVRKLLLADEETRLKLIARRDVSNLPSLVRELFKNGLSVSEIANKLKRDYDRISKIINENEELSKLRQEKRTSKYAFTPIAKELREFFVNGGSIPDAMKKFNLSRQQIDSFKRINKSRAQKQPDIPQLPDTRRTPAKRNVEIAEYYAQGATIKELSEMFELTKAQIYRILQNQKTGVDSKLSSGKTNRANRRANNSKLSSGSAEVSEMGKQRIQRRIAAYEEEAEKGDGSELKLPWDKDGKLKEKPIIVSEVDDDYDDDEELSKEEKENRAAALEYAKISREEMAERTRRAEESKRRLNSPEYLEQARLRRVARNKGQETITHNADGTIKRKDGEKLSSGSLINSKKYRKKHTALLKKILTKMDKEGAGWMDEDMRLARLDELEYNFGKSLRQTIEYWYGGADGVTYNMRDEIEGGRISKEVNELLSLIDISPVTSRPIYRGMRYMTQDQLDEIINRGVKLPLGAFSGQKTTALSYADGDSFNEAQVSVVLRLEPGVKAFPMKHFSPIDEEEYLVSGTFEVVGVSQTPVGRFGKTVTEVELKEIEDKPKLSSG